MDSSRYAMVPRREASRYAKKSGSRDSRILSRYAANNFDRPPRHWSIKGVLEGYQQVEESSPTISRVYYSCYNSNLHI
ncbi:hypothetical protein E3N88_02976 [Mikania micrantha]|uniref:Uncharacterized protein n=1 Tax=Mikania micrantha TaxID=192012 RepID=A0A5N6Q821_9ASTR|nr:hypothetical protein E3N88_02976 [Mikania micrantha]